MSQFRITKEGENQYHIEGEFMRIHENGIGIYEHHQVSNSDCLIAFFTKDYCVEKLDSFCKDEGIYYPTLSVIEFANHILELGEVATPENLKIWIKGVEGNNIK